jgi:hypothetical protein
MKKSSRVKPTPSELEILHILWSRGPSTVREIHDVLSKQKDVGYTSALKLLQIMTTKAGHAPKTSARTYTKPPACGDNEAASRGRRAAARVPGLGESADAACSPAVEARRKRSKKCSACSTNTRGNFHEPVRRPLTTLAWSC